MTAADSNDPRDYARRPEDDALPETRVIPRNGQVTAQILQFAARKNRDLAAALAESPRVTLSAAVLAFELLEPSIQVEMIAKARVAHLEAMRG
jgi:hypothetical protein